MSPRAAASTDHVAPLVRIAASLFAQQGYRGTSMRDIGREAGVHAGSLYVHIASKEDLLAAIVRDVMDRSERDMAEVLAEGGTGTQQLRAIAGRALRLIDEYQEFATVFYHEWRNLSEPRRQAVITSRDRWEANLRGIIAAGVESGEFRPVDPRIAGIALTSVLNWAYVWYSPNGELSTDQLADQFADLLITGLRATSLP
ncbi:MAG TPA: TetR/AcrR family transcriptional regulator [Lacunisphaera sp.]